jgi:hypothetical protein
LGIRLRLQDMARLMMEAVVTHLSARPSRSLHFLNIAGGPAIDSFNTIILLNKTHPGILAEREVLINGLDRDETGPESRKAALAALCRNPLDEKHIDFGHFPYDWSKAADLQPFLDQAYAQHAIVVCSSEGGLFEYGSDADIEANLKVLRPRRRSWRWSDPSRASMRRLNACTRWLRQRPSAAGWRPLGGWLSEVGGR